MVSLLVLINRHIDVLLYKKSIKIESLNTVLREYCVMKNDPHYTIRAAQDHDKPILEALIADSARKLNINQYTSEEIESAITHVYGVDSELVSDGTYFVVQDGDASIGCGGWSRRKTLFGGDNYQAREAGFLDPDVDAAKIRTFFVHPDWARKGVASALLCHCEKEIMQHGFKKVELMSTLPGLPFYEAFGYQKGEAQHHSMPDEVVLTFVPMTKYL